MVLNGESMEGSEVCTRADTLYFLTGPSAVGKTKMAVSWARRNGAEILSCDSILVYRGMDIGSAKPSREAQVLVPHHGLDLVDVRDRYSVACYLETARRLVAGIMQRGKQVLVTGGSGFYLKGFFQPVVDEIAISEEVREMVRAAFEERGLDEVCLQLRAADPEGAELIDMRNPRRVVRALERCLETGKGIVELRGSMVHRTTQFGCHQKRVCVLVRARAELRERVQRRTREMLEASFIEEVEELLKRGLEENPSAAGAIGYREVIEYLRSGDGSIGALEDAIVMRTMRLIRKQMTWFRGQFPDARVVALEGDAPEAVHSLFPDDEAAI